MGKEKKNPLQPVTMVDVAKLAGVSQPTVSRALRNDPRISEAVKSKVREAADKLDYRPNPLVSALTSQIRGYRRSPIHATICILHCLDKNDLNAYNPYYEGATRRAADLGYGTDLIKLHELDFSLSAVNRVIRARSFQGILVLPVRSDFSLEELDLSHIASATVDPSLRSPDLHRASPDYFQSMELALDQLASRGCKRISYCTWDDEQARIGSRWMGSYLRWHMLRGIKMQPFVNSEWQTKPFIEYIRREKPDAIVSNSLFYYNALLKQGIPVPDQISFASLVAVDGNSAIAGIDQRSEQIAAAAIDLVVSQMYRNEHGIPDLPKSVSIRGKWLDGATVPLKPEID
ncbi:LacI family DNA-binding transcriptional regulator [Pelagicoccus mobilis]|uniref:LacI family DNA-binding transcriptional regulator n=1 Tax=Pelagicoccus mobilis TaxID=415221 RepID=A0A934S488_9BACT|nr:LacI family DNA-binding transcriptional regulator [Pelagicoccus mobilis]MBK1880441.1 LacI family DNA-binding transcriptional regulator [Pelagicoccus mobilis]